MSWALSCLSLRRHYDEVALYTDSVGKHVLIDLLHLPYTEVNVVFDGFKCLPHHWALAKVHTYSLQEKPFIHVDGDVYLPNEIAEETAKMPVVIQNREIGTKYYKGMMRQLYRYKDIRFPQYIDKGFREGTLSSYNMGVFGGNDIGFVRKYCNEVFGFMRVNDTNNPECKHSGAWCNIFFEQMLLASLVERDGIEVGTVFGRDVEDEGYSRLEFCFFEGYEQMPIFHVLGGHKRNPVNTELLGKTLLRLHGEYHFRILRLYPERHLRLAGVRNNEDFLSREMTIAQYEDGIEGIADGWKDIPLPDIMDLERRTAESVRFLSMKGDERNAARIAVHPMATLYRLSERSHPEALKQIKDKLGVEEQYPLDCICVIPTLDGKGYKEVPVVEIQQKTISLLREEAVAYEELERRLLSTFRLDDEESVSGAKRLVLDETANVLRQGVLIATNY